MLQFTAADLEETEPVEFWFKQDTNGEPRAVVALVRLKGWGMVLAHRSTSGRWVSQNEAQGVHPVIAKRVEEILNKGT